MDELDEDELFTVCLDDDGHPVQRAVRDMTAGEVIAAIDHLTAGSTRIAVRKAGAAAAGRGAKAPQTELRPGGPRAAPATGDAGRPARQGHNGQAFHSRVATPAGRSRPRGTPADEIAAASQANATAR